jgi:hypothetical protein
MVGRAWAVTAGALNFWALLLIVGLLIAGAHTPQNTRR